MHAKYKVRFGPAIITPVDRSIRAPKGEAAQTQRGNPTTDAAPAAETDQKRRSRSGCIECRRRRVKCDETFPICLRCQRRGSFCGISPRLRQWQAETPELLCLVSSGSRGSKRDGDNIYQDGGFRSTPTTAKTTMSMDPAAAAAAAMAADGDGQDEDGDGDDDGADKPLLRYWLEKASQIMVINPDINPLSFPIVGWLKESRSLVHTLQSVGAAHQHFFHPDKLQRCLEERSRALRLIRWELVARQGDLVATFLAIFLLGLSTAWTESPQDAFRVHHLHGARALVDEMLLSSPSSSPSAAGQPAHLNLVLGAYIYWDAACSYLVPHELQQPLNTPHIYSAVLAMDNEYHAVNGHFTPMFYLLATVGRYCRTVVDTGVRDPDLESALEEELLQWSPPEGEYELVLLNAAYQNHGLINLAVLGRARNGSWPSSVSLPPGTTVGGEQEEELAVLESTIRNRALTTVGLLEQISTTHPCTNFQGIPLLTAASELTSDDGPERETARRRFRELYSLTRLRSNLAALDLLEELWALRDRGVTITWLEFMLTKNWNLMMG